MPDLRAFFHTAPRRQFAGVVFRICVARHGENTLSLRGSLLHGARYNLREYFGALYTSMEVETARREAARYYTVPPREGFVEARIELRLTQVVDLTNRLLLRKVKVDPDQMVGSRYWIPQEFGLRAWESGVEGLLAPSAAVTGAVNLVVLLDNQHPGWRIGLRGIAPLAGL